MSTQIDINADLGEEAGHDDELLPYISSVNIACGAHAGDTAIMQALVIKAAQRGIAIGAHPGYEDRAHFGRRNMQLSAEEIHRLVKNQLLLLEACCQAAGARMHHVKLHGALYNQSAVDPVLAAAACRAIADVNPSLRVLGLSGSLFLQVAASQGLRPVAEVFADRHYTDAATLVPREQPGALIDETEEAVAQALQLVCRQSVNTLSGKTIAIKAESVCVHGDGPHAVDFAKQLHRALTQLSIRIQPV